jgi:AcrR family transcriptional regulator
MQRAAQLSPGRPRDERIDSAVRVCVLELLVERGYRAVSINAVARAIGSSRATIYRRWRTSAHLIADALLNQLGEQPAADTGHVRQDLRAVVGTFVKAFAGPVGRALPGLISDMTQDRALAQAFQHEVVDVRRRSIRAAIARGIARGEIRDGVDPELLIDLLTAPFYFRLLYAHAPLTTRDANELVELVLRAAAPTQSAAAGVRHRRRRREVRTN